MTGFYGNIEKLTLNNDYFRQVIFTGKHAQLVLMSLLPGEEIGNEVHANVDQFFRIEQGEASFVLNNGKETHVAKNSDAVVVPAGTYHNVINASKTFKLKLYTVYSPPNHPDGTIHKNKAEAEAAEAAEHH
jgi:mannose-6-phosphate isomerase-like protein (cupin superfamily)